MSLIKILPEYLETFSLRLHPQVNYLSSSYQLPTSLTTGSMPLAARPSKCLKNLIDPSQHGQNSFAVNSPGAVGFNEGDYSLVTNLESISETVRENRRAGTTVSVLNELNNYMTTVNSSSQIARNTKRLEITRFDPPFTFTKNSTVKNITRNVLMPYYISDYDMCQFGYTNYSTLNFFTGSGIPTNSAILYPNFWLKPGGLTAYSSGSRRPYSPSGPFTFDFYINPRYTNDVGKPYHAGTILHVTSTYAVSLISGSLTDGDGSAGSFRILLQLSHSADVPPDRINLNVPNNKRPYPQNLAFVSDDHALLRNHWHHVSIRWGTRSVYHGTGTMFVDNRLVGKFAVNSGSILPARDVACGALVLGNYLNLPSDQNEARFFNETDALAEGVYPYLDFGSYYNSNPNYYNFKNPLNAELHDIKILDRYVPRHELVEFGKSGRKNTDGLMFYVPPFFVKETRTRESLITPFQTERKSPAHPFNTTFSFGVGGFMMNLQNHVREFKRGAYPRLINLTASTIDYTVLDITANGYAFGTASNRKRNLTILPNDNGLFTPDFDLLLSGTVKTSMSTFKHILGGYDLSMVSINEMCRTGSAYKGLPTVSPRALNQAENNESLTLQDDTSPNTIVSQIAGVTPTRLGGTLSPVGPILTIFQRTRDPSSNEISMFDISNLFYGNRILPESFHLYDNNLSGSGGKIRMTLKDNGKGGLYRADSLTKHAKWANVGTILYNEGIVVIKNPSLSYFGKREFETQFKGEHNAHILTINMPAGTGLINSSSNPVYQAVSASFDANEYDPKFVYITGFNLHDDNLNVIMRGNLAQPVKKRQTDEMVIKFKMDF